MPELNGFLNVVKDHSGVFVGWGGREEGVHGTLLQKEKEKFVD